MRQEQEQEQEQCQGQGVPLVARRAVHAASGKRLGAAHPRQEGPTDLRLVPPALAAWATAALALHAAPGLLTGVVVTCLVVAGGLLLRWRVGRGERGRWGGRDRRSAVERPRPRVPVAAVLLCVAAAAASAGLHGADLRRGPVPGLARQFAWVSAEVEVTSDPRLTRPRVTGNHLAPASVLLNAQVRGVEVTPGTPTMTRTPVLVIVDAERGAGREWLTLLPSTRVRVTGRLAPAAVGGDRIAAGLRVRCHPVPGVGGAPPGAHRPAGA
ncbi:MBL fold metallo-hydrolase, partial [Streptomyces sp. PSKA30]|nr:MBL fold metallo-hydrolase [Streptomyces sp. PSKA30]